MGDLVSRVIKRKYSSEESSSESVQLPNVTYITENAYRKAWRYGELVWATLKSEVFGATLSSKKFDDYLIRDVFLFKQSPRSYFDRTAPDFTPQIQKEIIEKDLYKINGMFHSHPNISTNHSEIDLASLRSLVYAIRAHNYFHAPALKRPLKAPVETKVTSDGQNTEIIIKEREGPRSLKLWLPGYKLEKICAGDEDTFDLLYDECNKTGFAYSIVLNLQERQNKATIAIADSRNTKGVEFIETELCVVKVDGDIKFTEQQLLQDLCEKCEGFKENYRGNVKPKTETPHVQVQQGKRKTRTATEVLEQLKQVWRGGD